MLLLLNYNLMLLNLGTMAVKDFVCNVSIALWQFSSLPDENCQSVIETLQTKFLPFTAIVQDLAISSMTFVRPIAIQIITNLSGFIAGIFFLFFFALNLSNEKRLNTLPSAQAGDQREKNSRTLGYNSSKRKKVKLFLSLIHTLS